MSVPSVVGTGAAFALTRRQTILDLVQQATSYKQLRKGANEGLP